jgi:hypothetical protein
MDELTFQSRLLQWLRAQGGYGQKLAHRFHVGVPDLLVMLPGPPPSLVLVECKIVRVAKPTTEVSVQNVTPMQRRGMEAFRLACIAVGLVERRRLERPRLTRIYFVPWSSTSFPIDRPHATISGAVLEGPSLAQLICRAVEEADG